MAEFASPTGIEWQGEGHGLVQFGDDSKMFCRFYWRSVRNEQQSKAANMPMFENIAYVIMHPPGERLNVNDRPAREEDKHRFPRQWNMFVKNQQQTPEGTPINLLYPNNPAYSDMLMGAGVYTVQQAANLSADAINNIGMGGQEVVNKAKRFIAESGDTLAYNRLREDNAKLAQHVKVLENNLQDQKKQIDELIRRLGNTTAPSMKETYPTVTGPYDPQSDRINSTHPTQELKGKKGKKSPVVKGPPKDEVEMFNQDIGLELVDEPDDFRI